MFTIAKSTEESDSVYSTEGTDNTQSMEYQVQFNMLLQLY